MPQFPQSWPLLCGCDWGGECFCGFECLSVFTLTDFSAALVSFNCDCVASAVLAISIALVKVSDESCSRSFDCTLGLAEPKISASIICLSSFVYLHSLIKTLTFLEMSQSLLVPVSVF